jgi:hypothetical protein
VKSTFSPENQVIIKLLESLKLVKVAYPPKLLAKRRAIFIKQVVQWKKVEVKKALFIQDQKVIKLLEGLKSDRSEYPVKMLARRRAAFIKQIVKWERVEAGKKLPLPGQDVIRLLEGLEPIKAEYPRELLAQRRLAFVGQVLKRGKISWWETLWSGIQNNLISLTKPQKLTTMGFMLASFVLISFIMIASLGSVIYGNRDKLGIAFSDSATQREVSEVYLPTPTSTLASTVTICKPGYEPPMCLAKTFDRRHDLTFQGNGLARAAVAKDTLPGYSGIHQSSYANDGLYGSGASWVSYSAHSWIKIDLGRTTTIDMVKFGKDRLGNIIGHNPGQFTIAVATSDNIYADGNSTNDNKEYIQVYDSKTAGFSGMISGSETIQASFKPIVARYIKITVTNPGAAIDEIEAFFSSSAQSSSSDETGKGKESSDSQLVSTNIPTNLPLPTSTPNDTPTLMPTNTLLPEPTDMPTFMPTNTPLPIPTDTPLPIPTDTLVPIPTDTPVPAPTDTPVPAPTDTPVPAPIDTLVPVSTP